MPVNHSRATVEAELNYLHNTGLRPVNYTFGPPPGVPRNSGEIDRRRVTTTRPSTRHRSTCRRTTRLTAHTAFEDPTTPPDAPARRSIEVRALAFW